MQDSPNSSWGPSIEEKGISVQFSAWSLWACRVQGMVFVFRILFLAFFMGYNRAHETRVDKCSDVSLRMGKCAGRISRRRCKGIVPYYSLRSRRTALWRFG
ncbi:hypothetical protein TPADAL_0082a [Treponema pallidum subsp. pallidum DAL-1]|uniref:Uncharacterized protein n=1 Tax=Treponema pallidum subsp. pertenue (strain Gauthier) TaxID=491080 RepID=A0AAU8PRH6_TREPG|nr:hypothetical protein TPESAMD_0082a [Treponema pallidum subsp. pertenue str. SamoaD]AEZ58269.1 hypothetical protein TPECDC2_0082a [Treponema pallidum subsp. pertenue str. CDC2]AEZ59337.1 hypothetical protein TPEGAU_0082a [Treponema pallidum subsp. pertenue str. Gauthier]AEZ60402.1 hypothetical protein TPADAL_0082a [Treponema pallidum subsp. pallidum DAL-1]AGK83725.1 hypothetical protein TPFB_0082a [Treponema pallidum str. Fribourg-Blanc]ASV57730.1 hypothetical protein TPEGhana051_0082a [Trep